MCGIIGGINIDSKEFIDKAVSRISHRGPDSSDTFSFENIVLGHTRLSILDLSDLGSQPMYSDDGKYVLIYNGELYNHNDIRKKISIRSQYKSHSDTETILYALIEFGDKIISDFNGIFAFAFYNKETGELLIARDHFGVKPLYYYQKGNSFMFGSEIKSFLDFSNFDKKISLPALSNYLNFLYSPGELTPFHYVKKLLPGHLLKLNTKKSIDIEVHKYYDIPFNSEYLELSENEIINQLEDKFFKAVERQMLSDVPIGFFLSGGLDSSAVVAAAKNITDKKLKCFTIDAGDEIGKEGFANDLDYAKLLAKKFDLDLEIIDAKPDILNDFDDMIYHLDEPQADPAPLNVYNICKSARESGYKVLLGGTAGDDIFSGYRRHQALNYEKYFSIIKPFSSPIKGTLDMLSSNNSTIRRAKKLLNGIELSKEERMANYFSWLPNKINKGLFCEEYHNEIQSFNPSSYLIDLKKNIKKEKNDLNTMLYWELKSFLVDHNLNYTDKMSMATGVETRVPFLDLDLVNFSTKIPPSLKMKGNETKYILKKMMEKHLPHDVIYRPKTGFGAPIRSWLSSDLKPMINDYLNESSINKRGIFQYQAIQNLINDNASGKIDAAYPILCLLAIESWFRKFVD